MLPRFEYIKPDTMIEACQILECHNGQARLLAGGTDLLFDMRLGKKSPDVVVDLKNIPELDGVRFDDDGCVHLGALTRTRDIELSKPVRERFQALSESVDVLAGVQIRNRASLGGNLCHASPSADTPPALMALDAEVEIASANGSRTISLDEFFVGPGKTVLETGEMLVDIMLPPAPPKSGSAYKRMTVRRAMDLAVVGVGVRISLADDGTCAQAGIALGAVAPTPIRADRAEARLNGQSIDEAAILEAGILAAEVSSPISDVRGGAKYRKEMVKIYTQRTITDAWQRALSVA